MMHQQRRIFRGRGGPNDRRLPKHNARRRKASGTKVEQSKKAKEKDHLSGVLIDELFDTKKVEREEAEGAESAGEKLNNDVRDEDITVDACDAEINLLLKRIKNNRESFTLSATALANPVSYQTNVLSAVQNCVKEWRGIIQHYADLKSDKARSTGQAVFELIRRRRRLIHFSLERELSL